MSEVSTTILNGKIIAQKVVDELKQKKRTDKVLAAVLVGDNMQSRSFLKQKEKVAKELGVEFEIYRFDSKIGEEELFKEVRNINFDKRVGGIILQLPLPKNFDRGKVISIIDPKKDIDALKVETRKFILPPAVETVKEILSMKNYDLESKSVAVVGSKGFLVGKPISDWLRDKCGKLIEIDIGDDLSQIKEADLVISGVGRTGLINPEVLKDGATVIDFGYDIKNGKISGDLDIVRSQLSILNYQLSWYTPTPGGTGPILVAELFKNFYKLTNSQ